MYKHPQLKGCPHFVYKKKRHQKNFLRGFFLTFFYVALCYPYINFSDSLTFFYFFFLLCSRVFLVVSRREKWAFLVSLNPQINLEKRLQTLKESVILLAWCFFVLLVTFDKSDKTTALIFSLQTHTLTLNCLEIFEKKEMEEKNNKEYLPKGEKLLWFFFLSTYVNQANMYCRKSYIDFNMQDGLLK